MPSKPVVSTEWEMEVSKTSHKTTLNRIFRRKILDSYKYTNIWIWQLINIVR